MIFKQVIYFPMKYVKYDSELSASFLDLHYLNMSSFWCFKYYVNNIMRTSVMKCFYKSKQNKKILI